MCLSRSAFAEARRFSPSPHRLSSAFQDWTGALGDGDLILSGTRANGRIPHPGVRERGGFGAGPVPGWQLALTMRNSLPRVGR